MLTLALPVGCKKDSNTSQPVNKGINPFIGKWKLTTVNGNSFSGNLKWQFSDTTLIIVQDSNTDYGSYIFNQSPNPSTIDIVFKNALPIPELAIYKLFEPDSLIVKLMDSATKRATNFNIEQGYILEIFRKQ